MHTNTNTAEHTAPASTAPASPWRTVAEAAAYLRVAEGTIRRMIREERLEAERLGRAWRIHVEELERLVRHGR